MTDLEQKQARLTELNNQLNDEYAKDAPDVPTVNTIISEVNTLQQQIADLQAGQQAAQQAEQAHQERVDKATDELSGLIDNLDLGTGLTLRNYLNSESDYQLVSIAIKQAVSAKLAAFSELIKGYDEREAQYQRQAATLQTQITTQQQQINALQSEKADLDTKLANAANELDKANNENDSLKAQLAANVKPADATPELTPEEKARRVLEKKAEITVYNVKGDKEINPINYTATLAATGEDITFNWTQKGRFIEVSEEEAARFREAYQAATQPEAAQPSAPVATEEVPAPPVDVTQEGTFQESTEAPISSEAVPAPAVVAEGAGADAQAATIAREEFDALVQRVAKLEQDNTILTANWPKSEAVA